MEVFPEKIMQELNKELESFREKGDVKGMFLAQAVKEYMCMFDDIDEILESLMETEGGDAAKAKAVATYLTLLHQGLNMFKSQLMKGGDTDETE